jgi:hypothetical protein
VKSRWSVGRPMSCGAAVEASGELAVVGIVDVTDIAL